MWIRMGLLAMLLMTPVGSGDAWADEIKIVDVKVRGTAGIYHFSVTLRHADSGWDHYADGWSVLEPGGAVLGTRVLAHPHVNEQPFTRSLGGVKIPVGVKQVHIVAHDKVHGDSPAPFAVQIP